MIEVELTNEIIKQRSLGLSYDHISTITGVSKPTVMSVCKKRATEITYLKRFAASIAKEEISEAINIRRTYYNKLVNDGINELLKRDLSEMSTGELLKLIYGSERSLAVLEGTVNIHQINSSGTIRL